MIQPLHDRRAGAFDVAVVDQITLGRIDLAFDNHIESKRMPVQSPALVAVGKCRQIVRGLEMKRLAQANEHRADSIGTCSRWQKPREAGIVPGVHRIVSPNSSAARTVASIAIKVRAARDAWNG